MPVAPILFRSPPRARSANFPCRTPVQVTEHLRSRCSFLGDQADVIAMYFAFPLSSCISHSAHCLRRNCPAQSSSDISTYWKYAAATTMESSIALACRSKGNNLLLASILISFAENLHLHSGSVSSPCFVSTYSVCSSKHLSYFTPTFLK